jgi:hypothetical protein
MKKITTAGDGAEFPITASNDQVGIDTNTVQLSRRTFIRSLTAGAAAIAMTACGGGGSAAAAPNAATATTSADPLAGSSGALTGAPSGSGSATGAPAWTTVPTISFTQGVAARISVAAYVSGAGVDAFVITKNSVSLPPGVTYDQATKSFVYDGIGVVGLTDGHVLTATGA